MPSHKSLKKLALAIIVSCFASMRLLPAAEQEVLDGLAAVVNDDVITFSQVRELVSARENSLRQTYQGQELLEKIKETRMAAVNDLIDRQLILQEFKKNKFNIPDFVVEDRIQTIIREEFRGDRGGVHTHTGRAGLHTEPLPRNREG